MQETNETVNAEFSQTLDNRLKSLINERGKIKAQITRFKTYLDNFHNTQDYIQLQTRLEKIETNFEKFDSIQSEIENLKKDEAQANERILFEDNYFDIISAAKRILSDHSVTVTRDSVSNAGSNTPVQSRSAVRLPLLNLPEFDGSYDEWMTFHDTFRGLIHNDESLTNIQKYYYLRSCLKGEAAQVIRNIEISNVNYPIAWNLLKERFENKRIIINKHIQSIVELTTIKYESHTHLRKFLDTILKNTRALKALGQPVDEWHTLLIYLLNQKLDLNTKKEWESEIQGKDFPNLDEFINFLTKRCQLLEKIETNNKFQRNIPKRDNERNLSHLSTQNVACSFCKSNHFNYQCDNFLKLTVRDRYAEVKKHKLCTNCLRPNHVNKECKSGSCKICHKKHNSLLHYENNLKQNNTQSNEKSPCSLSEAGDSQRNAPTTTRDAQEVSITTYSMPQRQTQVLLSTAMVYVFDKNKEPIECRALLDSGSQSNFITRNMFNKLKLNSTKINMPVSGINQALINIGDKTQATIKSIHNNYKANRTFLIIDKITEKIPQTKFDISDLQLDNVILADPCLNVPGPIDILLGVDIFWELLCVGQVNNGKGKPILQKTRLGWVIAGSITEIKEQRNSVCNLATNQVLHDQIEKFWRVEEIEMERNYSKEEAECELEFKQNFVRDEAGRFKVTLPLRENYKQLGHSYHMALKRFSSLENKLERNPELKTFYTNFMTEYESLGHMSRIEQPENKTDNLICYLPHHGVVKESSSTTKLRVVFDASAKTDSGVALNDVLKVGPVIQDDLLAIVLRFRQHNFVLTADISKMYRQVNISENQRDLQRIIWRENKDDELKHFKLNTVTYGTAPASFLAIRSLHQVALENKIAYPEASDIILKNFYVDDLMMGCNNVQNAKRLKREICIILNSAGFELRKWKSNNQNILFNPNDASSENGKQIEHYIDSKNDSRVLGLLWNSKLDRLQYSLESNRIHDKVTKRSILSLIARIFDPLGLIAPVTIVAKVLLQNLWQAKIEWDESVPTDIHTTWIHFRDKLLAINNVEIPRQVTISSYVDIQLHGFCDSSERALGACIYIRTTDSQGKHFVKLLCAKSKVAPLKVITLPRLELCSAVLLTRLVKKVTDSLTIDFSKICLWSDSTITLSWINAEPSTWKTFIANRVTTIHRYTTAEQWYHVNTKSNPADIITRSLSPESLENCQMWWSGPEFLVNNEALWAKNFQFTQSDAPERRQVKQFTFVANISDLNIFNKYSSLHKLIRVFAYCRRFIDNTSIHRDINNTTIQKEHRTIGNLTKAELDVSLRKLVHLLQQHEFKTEIDCLKNSKLLPKKSKLLNLNPFLDERDILRVGGRIRQSAYHFEKKHPILLPAKHDFTTLIIRNEHERLLHAGPQAVLASIRNNYWILNGKNTVKGILRKCVTCFRVKPINTTQPMGDLPGARLKPSRPFSTSGVDFAGPFLIKDGRLRNRKLIKAYLVLFVCFVTRAIHLDIVVDLTKESFLNALKRFIARRGIVRDLYSDNGLTFVGADNELKRTFQCILDFEKPDNAISTYLSKNAITWHFIPSRAPNFGGLWEAGVKSAKYHLKRIVGNAHLTFEELYTVVVQIEAILNSRPLTPMSSDPNDYCALTPSHFLIGDTLTSIPEENLEHLSVNRLSNYQRLQQIKQHFWTRWSKEYIATLQNRTKWRQQHPQQIPVNTLVLLKEDNTPPLQWQLARVVATHPGADSVVRVVSVKIPSGAVYKRAISKICILPIDVNLAN